MPVDVVNKEASIMAGNFVVKPVLNLSCLDSHKVFTYPESGELRFYVEQSVRDKILESGCTGLEFSKTPVT